MRQIHNGVRSHRNVVLSYLSSVFFPLVSMGIFAKIACVCQSFFVKKINLGTCFFVNFAPYLFLHKLKDERCLQQDS